MQVVYHLGVHCTDEDRLVKCLLKNRSVLAQHGTLVPGPSRYRPVLRETLRTLKGRPPGADAQEVLLDTIIDEDHAERLIISNDNFLCVPGMVLQGNALYTRAGEKCTALAQLFQGHEIEFHMAIRNPATFLPMLFAKSTGPEYDMTMSMMDPLMLRWSDTIRNIRLACPDIPITVWCDEDMPLIWPEVLRSLAGVDDDVPMTGKFDFLAGIMTQDGLKQLRARLEGAEGLSQTRERQIIADHLEEHALNAEMVVEVDMPDWNDDLVDALTHTYDDDATRIAEIPGVFMITP